MAVKESAWLHFVCWGLVSVREFPHPIRLTFFRTFPSFMYEWRKGGGLVPM